MTHVATVTVDSGQVPSSLTDFVVYIDLSDLGSNFWSTVANGGGDIRCYKSDGTTELAREVVSCDTSGKTGELHVKYAGTLSSTVDTDIQIHADGLSSDYAVGATYGRNSTWSDYEAVWHLEDDPSGTMTDSTGNGHDFSDASWASGDSDTGQIGAGVDKDASGKWFDLATNISVASSSDYTFQFWLNPASWNGTNPGLWRSGSTGTGGSFNLLQGTSGRPWIRNNGSDVLKPASGSAVASIGTMASQTFRFENSAAAGWFLNGVEEYSATHSSGTAPFTINNIGHHVNASPEWPGGIYDEMRFSASALSDDWIATEYSNQSDPATFYSVTDIGGATTLVAADLTHSHTIDAGALTQAHTLAGDDLTIGHSLDAGVLTQGYSLTGQPLDQSQTIDNAVLTQAHVLVAADLLHVHTIDSGALTVGGALAGADLSQTQALDLGALTQHNVLAGQDLSQGQTIDNAVLVVAGALNADPLTQSQIIEAAALVQNYVLSGQDLTQSQEIDSGVLSTGIDLTAQDLAHAQTIDAGALTQYHVLTADSLTQAQILQAASLGGVVIGELEGEIVIYAAIGGDVYTFPALSGTVH